MDVGPTWQSALHLPLTLPYKAQNNILRWLLKTERSAEQVSLYTVYMISPEKTPHAPWWEHETQYKSALQPSRISSRITQTCFIPWDNGAMKSVYLYIQKERVPGNLLYLLADPAPEPLAGGIRQRCRARTGWWDSCSEQQQARAQLPKIIGTHFSTASFPSVTYIRAVPCMQSSLESYTRAKTAAF